MHRDLTPAESLKVIENMIQQAKQSFHRMSFYFLLWGGLLTLATLFEFVMSLAGHAYGWLGWPVIGVLGGVLSLNYGARETKRQGGETMMDRVLQWLWFGFIVTMVIMNVCAVAAQQNPGPTVTILTGLPTFVTGAIMRFKPLLIGGVLFWCIGAISFFVPGTMGALLFAVAMFVGYIVPGLMLKRQENVVRTA